MLNDQLQPTVYTTVQQNIYPKSFIVSHSLCEANEDRLMIAYINLRPGSYDAYTYGLVSALCLQSKAAVGASRCFVRKTKRQMYDEVD